MTASPGQKTRRRNMLFDLSRRFGWICWYCGHKLDPLNATLDHVIPKCDGGTNDKDNLALACIFCNRAKWMFPLEVFLEWLDFVREGPSKISFRG